MPEHPIPVTLPVHTERLTLRPITDADTDDLHAFLRLPEVARYMYWEPKSRQQVSAGIGVRYVVSEFKDEGDIISLAMELTEESRVIGELMLARQGPACDGAEIGFTMHPAYHRRGLGAEGATAMLRMAFGELGLHRVIGRCDGRNEASIGLMTRLGMRREAHFIKNEIVKGEWTDEMVFAMLAADWQARTR